MKTHTINIDECNRQGYRLYQYDKIRIQPFKDVIESNQVKFRFFGTINYWFKMDDYDRLIGDTRHLKSCLQKTFKCGIQRFHFNEKHLNPQGNLYGGFHRHWLMEDIPDSIWLNPNRQMGNLMLEFDEKHDSCMYFGSLCGDVPSDDLKIKFINKVIRGFHHSCPNGYAGLDVRCIYNLDGILSYCTKQNTHNIPNDYVIDTANSSHLDNDFIRRMNSCIRHHDKQQLCTQHNQPNTARMNMASVFASAFHFTS